MGIAGVNALAGNQLLLRRSDRKFLSASMQPLLDADSESLDGPSA